MRLIDADELKKEMESSKYIIPHNLNRLLNSEINRCIEAIDNAPTVEPPKQLVLRARNDEELEQLKEAWGKGEVCFTPIVAYTARPQGKWIFVSRNCWKCPNCQELTNEGKSFCPNCGARMGGG